MYTLSNPGTFTVGANTFTAPEGAQLQPNTAYFMLLEYAHGSGEFRVARTSSTAEDSAATGWSIENTRVQGAPGNWSSGLTRPHLITVNGSPRPDAPTITQIEFTSNAGVDDTYGIEDGVEITVTFSTQITVDGTPQLTLNVGTGTKTLNCAAHATALTNLVCSYAVAENDAADTDGISIGANSLALNGATISYQESSVSADLDHAGVPSNPGHKVNGDPTAPTITGITITSTPSFSSDTYGEGEAIEISVTFSLPVWSEGDTAPSVFIPMLGRTRAACRKRNANPSVSTHDQDKRSGHKRDLDRHQLPRE